MKKNLPGIDDVFKDGLNKLDEVPSEAVWNNIDKALDKRRVTFFSNKVKKWRWVAAACLLFTASMAMYVVGTRLYNSNVASNNTPEVATPAINPSINEANQPGAGGMVSNTDVPETVTVTPGQPKPVPATETVKNDSVLVTTTTTTTKSTQTIKAPKAVANNQQPTKKEATANINLKKVTGFELATVAVKPPAATAATPAKKPTDVLNATLPKNNKNLATSTTQNKSVPILKPDVVTAVKMVDLSLVQPTKSNFAVPGLTTIHFTAYPTPPQAPVIPMLAGSSTKGPAAFKPFVTLTPIFTTYQTSNKVKIDKPRFNEDDRNFIKRNQEAIKSSSVGLLLNYQFARQWSIETGIVSTNISTRFAPKIIIARPDLSGKVNYHFSCAAGFAGINSKTGTPPRPGDSISVLAAENELHYVSIPLGIRYRVTTGRFQFQPGLGVDINLLLKSELETILATSSGPERVITKKINGLKNNYLNGNLSVLASYKLTNALSLSLLPVARFSVNTINKEGPVKTHYNSLGLGMGISVRL